MALFMQKSNMMNKRLSLIFALVCACVSAPVYAEKLHGQAAQIASLCTAHFTRAETKYGIPKHLLLAIANTESGRYNHGLKRVLPWPWTLNIEGKGSYHNTMHDAITAVNRAKSAGKKSIDTGCMQVNLKHHPHAFSSVRDALDPARNVDYAARFLRSNFDDLGSWPKAIAAYHSRSSKGAQYFAMVQKRWRDVRGIARGNLLENTDYVVANSETINGVKVSRFTSSATPRSTLPTQFSISVKDGETSTVSNASFADRYNGKEKRIAAHVNITSPDQPIVRTSGMKVIKVSDAIEKRDDTVVTVTPVALRANAEQFVFNRPQKQELDTRLNVAMTETDDAATTAQPQKRHQPHFIFGRE
jgi:hypothetical protein